MTVPTNAQCAGEGGGGRRFCHAPPRLRQQDIVLNACLCHCRPPPPSHAQPHSHLVCWAYLAGSFSHCLHIPWLHFFLPAPPLCPCLPHTGILFALSTWHLYFSIRLLSLSLFLAVSPRQLPFSLQASGWRKCRHYTVRKCVANL